MITQALKTYLKLKTDPDIQKEMFLAFSLKDSAPDFFSFFFLNLKLPLELLKKLEKTDSECLSPISF